MKEIVVDTSSWISYFSSGAQETVIEAFLEKSSVVMPSIVVAEILSGKMSKQKHDQVVDFLSSFQITGTDFEHWVRVGGLRSKLARKGFSISTPDCHVAQVALDHSAWLLSEDKIFSKIAKIAGLKLV